MPTFSLPRWCSFKSVRINFAHATSAIFLTKPRGVFCGRIGKSEFALASLAGDEERLHREITFEGGHCLRAVARPSHVSYASFPKAHVFCAFLCMCEIMHLCMAKRRRSRSDVGFKMRLGSCGRWRSGRYRSERALVFVKIASFVNRARGTAATHCTAARGMVGLQSMFLKNYLRMWKEHSIMGARSRGFYQKLAAGTHWRGRVSAMRESESR